MNSLKKKWIDLETKFELPYYINSVKIIDYNDFLSFENASVDKLSKIVDNLFNGDYYIVKNAIKKDFINELKKKLIKKAKNTPSEFYKMYDNCPNYRREIDEDAAKKYSIKAVRNSFYFFRWNGDEMSLFKEFDPLWRIVKILGGLDKNEYVKNIPSDGVIDRIQVVKYPPLTGYIEPHHHNTTNQKLMVSIYMSEKGKDYSQGGTYFYKNQNGNDLEVEVESNIKTGDVGMFYGSLKHSVKAVEVEGIDQSQEELGRWWCGLYSPESDHVENRKTSRPSIK